MREHPGVQWLHENYHLLPQLAVEWNLQNRWIALDASGPIRLVEAEPIAGDTLDELLDRLQGRLRPAEGILDDLSEAAVRANDTAALDVAWSTPAFHFVPYDTPTDERLRVEDERRPPPENEPNR